MLNNMGRALRIHNCQSDPMPHSQSLSSRKDNRYVTANGSVSSLMMEMLSNMGEDLGAHDCLGAPFQTPPNAGALFPTSHIQEQGQVEGDGSEPLPAQ